MLVALLLAVVAVSLLYPRWLNAQVSLLLMLPVLGYSLWQLVNWGWPAPSLVITVVAGLGLGLLLLIAGLPLSSGSIAPYLGHAQSGLAELLSEPAAATAVFSSQLLLITYEELIWRVFLLSTLSQWIPLWLAVLIASALFWYVHEDNREPGWHSLEFFLFAVALSLLFLWSNSLWLICAVHAGRNLPIIGYGWISDTNGTVKPQ